MLGVEEVVAVHVGDEHRVDRLDPQPVAGPVEHAVEMLAVEKPAVDEQRMAVVGDEHVEVHPVLVPADLVEVRRDLPQVRHHRGP